MTASASGATSSGSIPASLAALLNLPPHPLALSVPQFFGTTVAGSLFSAPIPPSPPATASTPVAPPPPAMAPSGSFSTLTVIPATSGEALPAEPPAASLTAPPTTVIPIVPAPPPAASVTAVVPAAALPTAAPAAGVITPAGPFNFDNLIAIRLTPDNYLFWRAKVLRCSAADLS
nr:classical arabinogalactan protein 4-like [Aegilops tauschii subsp. strangulata]